MRKPTLSMLLFVCSVSGSSAAAQACLGLPSFAGGSVHVNGAGEFPDSATSYALALSGGTHDGLFGNVGAGQVEYSGFREKSTLGFLEFGIQKPVRRAQVCPIVGGYLGVGPDEPDLGLTVTSYAGAAGLAVGVPLGTRTFRVIPNVAARYQYTAERVEQEEIGSSRDSFSDAMLDLGLGFVILDRLGIQPIAHIPVSGARREISYGVFVSASLWRGGR